jgi:hypothetical protein
LSNVIAVISFFGTGYSNSLVRSRLRPINCAAAVPVSWLSRSARLLSRVTRPAGATVEQIIKATDWQPHTVRGFFAGALKKRLGIEVTSEPTESEKRIYRIAC